MKRCGLLVLVALVVLGLCAVSCNSDEDTTYTASYYKSLFDRVSDLEKRVDALEAGWASTSTTTTAPSTTTTRPPSTTTSLPTTTTRSTTTTTQSTTTTTTPSNFDLQQALNAAPTGGTVVVPTGTYLGPFTITKDLTVKGPAVLTGSGSRQSILLVSGCTVTLDGLTIQGTYTKTAEIGIELARSAGGTFRNLAIRDVGYAGIMGFPTKNLTVENCTITHCGDFGVHTKDGSDGVTVRGCTLSGFESRLYPGHGIYFSNSTNCTATGNTISNVITPDPRTKNEVSGIKFAHSTGSATSNRVSNSFGGISVPGGYNVTVADNTITNVTERGIYLLAGAHDVTVRGNTVQSQKYGIQCSHYPSWPYSCVIQNNNVTAPTPYSPGSSTGFTVSGNSWE